MSDRTSNSSVFDDEYDGPVDGMNAQHYERQYSAGFAVDEHLGEEEDGTARLYNILVQAVPQSSNSRQLRFENAMLRRESAEQTWAAVRRWLDAYPSVEDRASAAYIRGDGDQTPLHLMCKIFDPPLDCVRAFLEAAHEVASWKDTVGGWLPLHLACAGNASSEVISCLIQAHPEGKATQDLLGRTPLHFCATSSSTKLDSLRLLCDTGAAKLTDRGGMLPMHYACAYGTSPDVLRVLADAHPDGIFTKELNGRTPMHLAMSNAHRSSNSGVIQFLVEYGGEKSVNMRDSDGHLPLHLLVQGLTKKRYNPEEQKSITECLGLYLAARPKASADFLTALQDLPNWAQDVAVDSPHVREMLNKKIVRRFHTCILMLDGYMLLVIIFCLEITTQIAINNRYGSHDSDEEKQDMNWYALVAVFLGVFYFTARELIQVISLILLGSLSSWFQDSTNWLDMTVIVTVTHFSILLADDSKGAFEPDGEAFRAGVTFTKGVLWMAVIYYLKSTYVDFAVFVGGVFYVLERLIAFLLAIMVTLLSFAQMFYFIYKVEDVCTLEFTDLSCKNISNATENWIKENPSTPLQNINGKFSATHNFTFDEENTLLVRNVTNNSTDWEEVYYPCDCPVFPHCEFKDSFIKVYSMMMGEIGSETRYQTSGWAQGLYILYAFSVVILLSNVLIAIVTDLYEIIQNDRAAIVFWQNRLDFVAEMDAISYGVRKRLRFLLCDCCGDAGTNSGGDDPEQCHGGAMEKGKEEEEEEVADIRFFRQGWDEILILFDADLYDEIAYTDIEFYTYHIYRMMMLIFVPIWLVVGLATAGYLWPPQIREYLFEQQETVVSRSELERKKLEKLRDIDTSVKELRDDLVNDMNNDREDFVRLRTELSVFQDDILQDLMQINELMKTLLDLGGGRL